MFAKPLVERGEPCAPRAAGEKARGRLGWRALVPLLSFLLCMLGTNEPPEGAGPPPRPPEQTCPAYDEETFPDPSPLETPAPAGALGGAFSVSQTGEARYTMPLFVPPGRAGMEPRLSISYASGSGQGLLGVGFGLQGLSAVTRCGSNMAQDGVIRGVRYDARDNFCLDGARLVKAGVVHVGVVEYRTFPDTFKKILAYYPTDKGSSSSSGPERFEVYTKSGRVLHYGGTADSRPMALNQVVASWWINREEDRRQNAVEYLYQNELTAGGYTTEHYPTEIRYTSHPTSPATRAVRFQYQPSSHHRTFFSGGMQLQHSKLLSWIHMIGPDGAEVRTYALAYGGYAGTFRPVLEEIRECAQGTCKRPTRFTWSSHAPGALTRTTTLSPSPPDPVTATAAERMPWILADVTGDGLDDIVTSELSYVSNHGNYNLWRTSANSGLASVFAVPGPGASVDLVPYSFIDPAALDVPWSGIPFDYDMDGRKDFFLDTANADVLTWRVLHSLPNGGFDVIDTGIAHAKLEEVGRVGVLLADLNGDGAADLITCDNPSYASPDVNAWTHAAARWTVRLAAPATTGFEPVAAPISLLDGYRCDLAAPGRQAQIKIVDVDADGKLDLMVPGAFPSGSSGWCPLDGSCSYGALSYVSEGDWALVDTGLPYTNGTTLFPDVNGDGLPDAVTLLPYNEHPPSPVVYMNTGRGFAPPLIDLAFPQLPGNYQWGSYAAVAQLIDYNGDGAVDILMPMSFHCGIPVDWRACWVVLQASNTEIGKFSIKDTLIPFSLDPAEADLAEIMYSGHRYRAVQVADVDGDGRHDIVVPEDPYFAVYKNDGPQDLLVSVTDGMNPLDPGDAGFMPSVSIEYDNLVDDARTLAVPETSVAYENMTYLPRFEAGDDCAFPRTCVVGARRVVSRYRFNNGANAARSFTVRYRDGRVDHLGRGFLGFGARIVIDDQTQAGTVEHYDHRTYDATFATYPLVGHAVRTWSWTPGMPGQVEITYTNTRYEVVPSSAAPTYFTLASMHRVEREEGLFSPTSLQTYFSYVRATETSPATILGESWHVVSNFDEYGNLLGELALTDNVDLTTITHRAYSNDPATWLIGRLDSEEVCSTALAEKQCRKTEILLRNQYGEVVATKIGDPTDPQTELTTASVYDTYGNVVHASADDAFGHHRWSCVSYDPDHIFPYASRNGAGHTTYTQFDGGLGVVTAVVDPNQLLTERRYDGFGRLVEEIGPDGSATSIYITHDKLGGPQNNWYAVQTYVTSDGHGQTFTDYDAMGRAVHTQTRAPRANVKDPYGSFDSLTPWYIHQETQYDGLGRVAKVSLPWKTSDPASSRLYHQLTYDGAGRVSGHVTPWGSTISYAYDKNKSYVTDSAGTAVSQVDELGRTIAVTDKHGKVTSYVYGPFSGLRSVSNVGEVTTTVRDAYGRVRHAYDPDRHGTATEYDGFGEVTRTVDALRREYELEYDVLGRLVQRNDPDGATTWEYDTKPNGIGRIGRVTSPSGHVKDYAYDGLSRPKEAALTIGGETFSSTFEYDGASRLARITYPPAGDDGPLVVAREYDNHGHVLRIYDDTTGSDFWRLDYVDRTGRPALEQLGNGVFVHHAYFAAEGAVRAIQVGRGPALFQDLRYAYDDRLNVESRTDLMQVSGGLAMAEVFEYDALDRLKCAGFVQIPLGGGTWKPPTPTSCALSVAYAANGNIDNKSDVGAYKYHASHPHAVKTAGADYFEYDEVGNQIARPGATLEYTPFDLPSRITRTDDGTVITLDYDGDQQRIRKTTSKYETVYLDDLYERVTENTGAVKHRYYVGVGSATLVVTRAKAQEDEHAYVHPDVLGSPGVVTDKKGNVVETRSYDAFGARRNPKWGQPPDLPFPKGVSLSYTGHEPDDEVGLINMRGRIYDPRVARFLQTDPIVSHPGFSQAWNAYSYVLNNPMKFTDPTGFDAYSGNVYVDVVNTHTGDRTVAFTQDVINGQILPPTPSTTDAGTPKEQPNLAAPMADPAVDEFTVNTTDRIAYVDSDGAPDPHYLRHQKEMWNHYGNGGAAPYGWEPPEHEGPIFPGSGEYLGKAGRITVELAAGSPRVSASLSRVLGEAGAAALSNTAEGGMFRRAANTGQFSELAVPMQMRFVKRAAQQGGIGLRGVKVQIIRDPSLVGKNMFGYTPPRGTIIQLYPDAFTDWETLVKTLGHERTHVMQIRIFGVPTSTIELQANEAAAYAVEESFWQFAQGAFR